MAEKDPDFIPSNSSDVDVEVNSSNQLSQLSYSTPVPYKKSKKRGSVRYRKARFTGVQKQMINKQELSLTEPSTPLSTPSSQSSFTYSTVASLKIGTPSSESYKRIFRLKLDEDENKFTSATIPQGNLVIDAKLLQNVLDMLSICSLCRKGNIQIYQTGKASCATNLIFKCNNCDNHKSFWSVSGFFGSQTIKISDNVLIPKRNDLVYSSVLGGRLIGCGEKSLALYHASLNIPLPPSKSTFYWTNKNLVLAAEIIAIDTMKSAKYELCDIHNFMREDPVEVVASYDGAYQQRGGKAGGGHSRYCFASCISIDTGKVLSYGVACNSCSECSRYENLLRDDKISLADYNIWIQKHTNICPAEYSGKSSVHLESAIAPLVVSSALSRGVIFFGLVSDGDNKTDDALKSAGVYKSLDREIERFECLSHVCKRLKSNLYKAQDKILKSAKSEKAHEKKNLLSKGTPTSRQTLVRDSTTRANWGESSSKEIKTISEAICGQIASYYRRAVQQNVGNIDEIIRAIHAIPYHLGANDTNASEYHKYCPDNATSWCKYKSEIYSGQTPPKHPNFLSENCVNLIVNLFSEFRLDTVEFVKKIAGGKTSNHNEAIHSMLFRMIKKTEAVGMDIMKLGSALAVIRYNEGFKGITKLYQLLGIESSEIIQAVFNEFDKKRIYTSRRIISEQQKRYHKKQRRGVKDKKQILKHGPGYKSSGYTAAYRNKSSNNSSDSEEDIVTSTTSSIVHEDYCLICNGTESNRIVGIGLTVIPEDEEIDWIQCSGCLQWFHFLCEGIEKEDVNEDVDWYCPTC